MRLFALLFICLPLLGLPALARADCVILLHGLARTESSFIALEEVLEARGYDVVSPTYPSTRAPIETLVQMTLPPALAACGPQRVHFVTHSMGGILVRYAFRNGPPDNLGRVVMLGPPNQGSQLVDRLNDLAVFGWVNGPAGAQLGTGARSLPHNLPPVFYPVGVIAGSQSLNPFFSSMVDGPDDGKVGVAETRVAGMAAHLTLPVTHTFMMNNPTVMVQAIRFIETGRFDRTLLWSEVMDELISGRCPQGMCSSEARR